MVFGRVKNGPAFNLLDTQRLFILHLRLTEGKHDEDPSFHCVYYNGTQVIDNRAQSNFLQIEDNGRTSVHAARAVLKAITMTRDVR